MRDKFRIGHFRDGSNESLTPRTRDDILMEKIVYSIKEGITYIIPKKKG